MNDAMLIQVFGSLQCKIAMLIVARNKIYIQHSISALKFKAVGWRVPTPVPLQLALHVLRKAHSQMRVATHSHNMPLAINMPAGQVKAPGHAHAPPVVENQPAWAPHSAPALASAPHHWPLEQRPVPRHLHLARSTLSEVHQCARKPSCNPQT
jgi:hypothetical protein